jgi:hypothetical protein
MGVRDQAGVRKVKGWRGIKKGSEELGDGVWRSAGVEGGSKGSGGWGSSDSMHPPINRYRETSV